jgi:RNA polymerase sigma factor (sigma-70 family)
MLGNSPACQRVGVFLGVAPIESMSVISVATTHLADHEAARLETIYRAEIGRLQALGAMLTGSRAAGEDLAHDAFLESVRRGTRDPGYLRDPAWPWLRLTMVRLATRRSRRLQIELRSLRLWRQEPPEIDWAPATDELLRVLRRLPPRMRACITLRYVDDLANVDIASTVGCSVKTVENQLRVGRARLRQMLNTSGLEDADTEATP